MKVMKRKFVAFTLIIAMLISFVPVVPAKAVEPTITLNITGESSIAKTAKAGDVISVDVMYENGLENQIAIGASIKYDNTKLKFNKDASGLNNAISNGTTVLQATTYPDDGTTAIMIAYEGEEKGVGEYEPIATSGRLATLTFTVLEDFNEATEISVYAAKSSPKDGDDDLTITSSSVVTINPPVALSGLLIKTPTGTAKAEETANLNVNDTLQLTAVKQPDGVEDDTEVTWETDNQGVATVSKGLVKAVGKGQAKITAKCSAYSATCTVNVSVPMTGLRIDPPELNVKANQGAIGMIKAIREPADTTDTTTITWESDNSIVGVGGMGDQAYLTLGSGGKAGKATITARCGEFTATCVVTVTLPMKGIEIYDTETSSRLGTKEISLKGGTIQLHARTKPEGSESPIELTKEDHGLEWVKSGDPSIIDISEDGVVTPLKTGSAIVWAHCSASGTRMSDSCTIIVVNELQSLKINEEDQELNVTQTLDLTVTFNPDDTSDSKAVEWTSDKPEVAKVENGKVTAVAPGKAVITVKSVARPDLTDSITITVPEVKATQVVIDKKEVTLNKGETDTLKATILPEDNTDNKEIKWSSSAEDIVSVDQNGKITANKGGSATIYAEVEGLEKAECKVNVISKLESISIKDTEVTLEKGATKTLEYVLNPEDTTADVSQIKWKSLTPKVATVDETTGEVTAVAPGTAIIEVSLDGLTATCKVTVVVTITDAKINGEDNLEMVEGTERKLSVTVTPSDVSPMPKATWTSSSEETATVDENGVVKALKAGQTTIKVSYEKAPAQEGEEPEVVEAEITITVKEAPESGIVLDTVIDELLKGEEVQLSATVYPESEDAEIEWSVNDDSIASIDENGKLVGKAAGTVTVTAKSGSNSTTMEVEVKEVPMVSIEVKAKAETVEEGEKTEVVVECEPKDSTDEKEFTYESSDPTIADVDENGVITGKKAGKVTITVTSKSNENISSSFEFEVKEKSLTPGGTGGSGSGSAGGVVSGTVGGALAATVASPHTGDMNIGLLITMLIISILGIICVVKKK